MGYHTVPQVQSGRKKRDQSHVNEERMQVMGVVRQKRRLLIVGLMGHYLTRGKRGRF